MTQEPIRKLAAQADKTVENAAPPLMKATSDAATAIRHEAEEYLTCASEAIRKNPVPFVAGAVAFGVALGYLIASGRHQETFQERYINEPLDHATDALSSTLGKLYGNLKFW